MLDTLKCLNIQQRLVLNTLQFIQKIKTRKAPTYLTEHLLYIRNVQPYHLRNTEDLLLPMATTTSMQSSLFFQST